MNRSMGPTVVTLVLSAAAVLGYLTYRFTLAPGADRDAPVAATATETVGEAAASLPDELPVFSLADLDGTEREITSFAGRPLVINFWATWCAPCLREIPLLKDYQAERGDAVRVVGIAVDYLEPVTEFAAEMQFNYPVLVGQSDGMNAASAFGVDVFALPFTVFTDADGAVVAVRTGEIHAEHLQAFTAVAADLASGAIDLAAARERLSDF